MTTLSLAIPIGYSLIIFGLCTYLLVRGITHLFVGLFAGGALLHMIPSLGFMFFQFAPGGLSANARYLPFLSVFGALGALVSLAAFACLVAFLLRLQKPQT
jgi:hypothetical protein